VRAQLHTRFPQWSERLGDDHLLDLALLGQLSDTALTDARAIEMKANGLPNTFVPGRNLLFFTFAAPSPTGAASSVLVGGMCETDYSGYPDCRDNTLQALQVALSLGHGHAMTIETPLMWLDKAQTWALRAPAGRRGADRADRRAHPHLLPRRPFAPTAWGRGCGRVPGLRAARRGYKAWAATPDQLAATEPWTSDPGARRQRVRPVGVSCSARESATRRSQSRAAPGPSSATGQRAGQVVAPFRPVDTRVREAPRRRAAARGRAARAARARRRRSVNCPSCADQRAACQQPVEQRDAELAGQVAVAAARRLQRPVGALVPLVAAGAALGDQRQRLQRMRDLGIGQPVVAVAALRAQHARSSASTSRARCPLAVCAVTPAAAASSPAATKRPSTSAASMRARVGSPIIAATFAKRGSGIFTEVPRCSARRSADHRRRAAGHASARAEETLHIVESRSHDHPQIVAGSFSLCSSRGPSAPTTASSACATRSRVPSRRSRSRCASATRC
jgi:7-cyano-7-deazaguanine synthase